MNKKSYTNFTNFIFELLDDFRGRGVDELSALIYVYGILIQSSPRFKKKNSTDRGDVRGRLQIVAKEIKDPQFESTIEMVIDRAGGLHLESKLSQELNFGFNENELTNLDKEMLNFISKRSRGLEIWDSNLYEFLSIIPEKVLNVDSLLELNCGPGSFLVQLANEQQQRPRILVGQERSRSLVLLAKLRALLLNEKIEVHNGDINAIPSNSFFDIIVWPHLAVREHLHLFEDNFQYQAERLNKNGRLIILSNSQPLTSGTIRDIMQFQMYGMSLEKVIKLPGGFVESAHIGFRPYLSFFSKNARKSSVDFWDLSEMNSKPSKTLPSEIIRQYFSDYMLSMSEDVMTSIPLEEIATDNDRRAVLPEYQLNRKRIERIEREHPNSVPLKEIGSIRRGRSRGKVKTKHPKVDGNTSVMNKDLHSDSPNMFVTSCSGVVPALQDATGDLLDQKCILVSTVGRFKVKIFDPKRFDTTVFANHGLAVIALDNPDLLEYVYFFFQDDFFKSQVDALFTGATIQHLSFKDLKELRVILPKTTEEAKEYVLNAKKRLIDKVRFEQEALEEVLKVKSEKEDSEFAIVRHIAHNMHPKLSEVESVLDSLKSFLEDKGYLNENIAEPLDETDEVESIGVAIDKALHKVEAMHVLISSTRDLVLERVPKDDFEEVNLHTFVKKIVNQKNGQTKKAKLRITTNSKPDQLKIRIHKSYFAELVENFLRNADRHAFDTLEKINQVEIIINGKADTITCTIKNNGHPFPKGLTTEKFLAFGEKSKSSPGEGLGGAFIKKVLDAHDGVLEIFQDKNEVFFKMDFKKSEVV